MGTEKQIQTRELIEEVKKKIFTKITLKKAFSERELKEMLKNDILSHHKWWSI